MVKHNPSDFTKAVLAFAKATTASTTVDFADADLIDTLGWTTAHVIMTVGTGNADISLVAGESDTLADSGVTAISGATLAHVNTEDNTLWQMEIDLHGKGRYMQLDLTAGAGVTQPPVTVMVILSNPDDSTLANQTFPTLTTGVALQGSGLA